LTALILWGNPDRPSFLKALGHRTPPLFKHFFSAFLPAPIHNDKANPLFESPSSFSSDEEPTSSDESDDEGPNRVLHCVADFGLSATGWQHKLKKWHKIIEETNEILALIVDVFQWSDPVQTIRVSFRSCLSCECLFRSFEYLLHQVLSHFCLDFGWSCCCWERLF
jgi:hypothetical protein